MTQSDLIQAIEAYARATGVAPATVTSRAVHNSRLYSRLKAGKGCTLKVAERVYRHIEDNPPQTEGATP